MKALRLILVLLLLVLAGVLGAQWLGHPSAHDYGEVFVRVAGHDAQASLPAALLALALLFLLLWLAWKIVSLPFRAWGRYRRKQARARLIDGFEALHGGQWAKAEKLLVQAAGDREVGVIARVAALRASSARGDDAASRQHLDALAQDHPRAHALAAADRALALQRPAEALAALDAAVVQPLPPRGLALRIEALLQSHRAGEAWGMLGALRQQQAMPDAELAALESRLAVQSIAEATDANVLAERWESLPKPSRNQADVVAAYAGRAAALRWDDAAVRSIEHALDARWDESLVALYGTLPVGKLDSRRASAQRWLQAHPDSPALLVALGRLARRQGQWPQAEDFLHRALAQGAGPEAWEELGHGYTAAGNESLARRSYANAIHAREGEATQALPGRDLKKQIQDEAVVEARNEHGLPQLRG
ncbi:porphyrin biosynthesis protein [Pseudoxanthomonas kalamensis DSM 18571]|uniref:heme biosynthesis protein HemY n=1 Tax=Pseudoxanthomonas kalamensis TaxID=289483 RepID=UPI0013908A61|nr:heme biosynthesis HemY N-terminal domain-containing protein [Pseudoxanthomonas kalamensis]KAF1712202.1 porphyrin biosynthesis protein [Pseudoxanthomonas kalamensis DSM 18571]